MKIISLMLALGLFVLGGNADAQRNDSSVSFDPTQLCKILVTINNGLGKPIAACTDCNNPDDIQACFAGFKAAGKQILDSDICPALCVKDYCKKYPEVVDFCVNVCPKGYCPADGQ
ncbi:MAG: hypothetical protein ACD_16C00205G0045 [uncultured bacterium]|nr:MAG: hypothetical protein ACD_16C00205G0045 [uncultured bacterium]OFW68780.1 MAG: hypothetical protein A2X70_04705 [Alphaproteobacteria bacterium GWC2_42_16]OFW73287.1 MAG: hypothetical protein A2Z80_03885 [Alphaproteobacteria bacterium GWA2_41_27]OFW81880.1 MAG: hypothetical protein A3E50_07160 [Alphaproteobacteria bacterium RIFCSPHIGHO2_12_FULL_42_100]OFW84871.1 MAG: hypothetical protein A2W06_03360 [Alphaproteobacteria bacterium RBG_16_42_14]OFW90990.1 MAG: hypothetical protein A3C41_041